MSSALTPLLLLTVLMLGTCVRGDEAVLPCYTCTSTEADSTCITAPEEAGGVPVTDCTLGAQQCCIIQRVDETGENIGTPVSFFRGCIEDCDPDMVGTMVTTEDFTHITYQTYCDNPKCNTGLGNVELGSDPGDGSYIENVPGIDNGPRPLEAAPLLMLATTVWAVRAAVAF